MKRLLFFFVFVVSIFASSPVFATYSTNIGTVHLYTAHDNSGEVGGWTNDNEITYDQQMTLGVGQILVIRNEYVGNQASWSVKPVFDVNTNIEYSIRKYYQNSLTPTYASPYWQSGNTIGSQFISANSTNPDSLGRVWNWGTPSSVTTGPWYSVYTELAIKNTGNVATKIRFFTTQNGSNYTEVSDYVIGTLPRSYKYLTTVSIQKELVPPPLSLRNNFQYKYAVAVKTTRDISGNSTEQSITNESVTGSLLVDGARPFSVIRGENNIITDVDNGSVINLLSTGTMWDIFGYPFRLYVDKTMASINPVCYETSSIVASGDNTLNNQIKNSGKMYPQSYTAYSDDEGSAKEVSFAFIPDDNNYKPTYFSIDLKKCDAGQIISWQSDAIDYGSNNGTTSSSAGTDISNGFITSGDTISNSIGSMSPSKNYMNGDPLHDTLIKLFKPADDFFVKADGSPNNSLYSTMQSKINPFNSYGTLANDGVNVAETSFDGISADLSGKTTNYNSGGVTYTTNPISSLGVVKILDETVINNPANQAKWWLSGIMYFSTGLFLARSIWQLLL